MTQKFFVGVVVGVLLVMLIVSLVIDHAVFVLEPVSLRVKSKVRHRDDGVESSFLLQKRASKLFVKSSMFDNHTKLVSLVAAIKPAQDSTIERKFAERRLQVASTCSRYFDIKPDSNLTLAKFKKKILYPNFILLDETHEILYCSVPKVASTSWRRFFVQLGAGTPALNVDAEAVHAFNATWPYLLPLSSYLDKEDDETLWKRISTFKKIIWVRDPLQRLLSAWRNKFQSRNEFYWKGIGRIIMRKFHEAATPQELEAGGPVTLADFFHYIAESHALPDIHWEKIHRLCLPCFFKYDYIGNLETGEDEANYVIEQATGQSEILLPPWPKDTREDSDRQDSLAQLARLEPSLVKSVLERYTIDFEMFGYNYHNF